VNDSADQTQTQNTIPQASLSTTPRKLETPNLDVFFTISTPDAVKFVAAIVEESVRLSASDILFEPHKDDCLVRVRIDGVLYELGRFRMEPYLHITSRIKVLSRLDPTEKRKVQEGQFSVDMNGAVVNLRVEITQTIHGEFMVVRIHKKESIVMRVSDIGLGEKASQSYDTILKERAGLVLVCGPTGCGKTTTLYTTITSLNANHDYNVITIEDPVEFQLDGVNQMQVQEDIGFTFAQGLKTILRLSPDIVLVGEIRDKETAEIAVESGLTGQLVFSTLHAEDSVGALFRLLDLGVETYLLNSALTGIISQRLVRRVCQKCKGMYTPNLIEIDLFHKAVGRAPRGLVSAPGCPECQGLGFKGRMGIFEVLVIDAQVRGLIRSKTNESEMRDTLIREGFITLLRDGLEKSEQGLTTVSEVLRNSLRTF
jgi:type IV pilus assembly protein PilB